jgi:hypothetical protein
MTSEKDIDPAYKDPRPGDDSGEGAAVSPFAMFSCGDIKRKY